LRKVCGDCRRRPAAVLPLKAGGNIMVVMLPKEPAAAKNLQRILERV